MRSVGGAGREVHEERLVGHQGLLLPHPGDGAVGEILGQRVALLGRLRRLDRRGALVQPGVVLVGLATDEAVEVLEAGSGRPLVERARGRHLPHGHLVALAELRGRIAVELQGFGDRRLLLGPDAAVARRRGRHLGDRAHADRVVVAAGQHRLPGRRAQRGGVEPVELQTIGGQPLGDRGVAGSAERRGRAEADVIDQHDQHVGRALGRTQLLDRRVLGVRVLGVVGGEPDVLGVGDRQLLPRQVRLLDRLRGIRVWRPSSRFDVFVIVNLLKFTAAPWRLAPRPSWLPPRRGPAFRRTSTVTLEIVPVNGNGDAYSPRRRRTGIAADRETAAQTQRQRDSHRQLRLTHLLPVDEQLRRCRERPCRLIRSGGPVGSNS